MSRKQWYIAIGLAAICTTAFMLRALYPYNTVFQPGYVSFLETDAYNRMWYAKQIAEMLAVSPGQAVLYGINNSLLFSFVAAVSSFIAPIEWVGAWLPPVIALLAVLATFAIGYALFNPHVGLLAALFVAIMPSEFLHRSLLGFADHHVLECFLLATFILLLIKAVQSARIFNRYSLLAGICLFLYMANWASGMYLAIIFTAMAVVAFTIHNLIHRENWYSSLPGLLIPLAIGLVIFLPLGGYQHFAWLYSHDVQTGSVGVARTGEMVTTIFAPLSSRTISELMPLLFPYGSFSLGVVVTNIHLFTITFIIGGFFLWRYRHNKAMWLLIIWTLLILVITLNHRRFMYYFSFNIALLSALAIYELAKYLKGNQHQIALFLAIPLILFSIPLTRIMGSAEPFTMTAEWHKALTWLKVQPGNGYVTAWGDYGHWIQYTSDKTPSYMPGPGGDLVAKLYFSADDNEAQHLLDQMHTDYLIVDKLTVTQKLHALAVYASTNPRLEPKMLAYRLYYSNQPPPFLILQYESANIKIWQYIP